MLERERARHTGQCESNRAVRSSRASVTHWAHHTG
jgi:hypothetical protein